MINAEEYLCRAANEYAISAQNFYCSAPSAPDVWVASGTWAGVIVAAAVGIYARRAWRTAQVQLEETKAIALNEQRIPALLNLLDGMDEHCTLPERLSSKEESARNRRMQRLVDRWTLTYPYLYESGKLRDLVHELTDFVSNLVRMRGVLSNMVGIDQLEKEFLKLISARDEANSFLRDLKFDLARSCRLIQSGELSPVEADRKFAMHADELHRRNGDNVSMLYSYRDFDN
ncbi:hypothetical protein [Glutamicibacter sp.]|uniref:hypothetical protein n=1 Tax=Glutamicibacter sp. TaxID=1931995 RepID=UPI003D6B86BA